MRVVTVEQMRAVEATAEQDFGLPGPTLMAHAGSSLATSMAEWLGGEVANLHVLCLIGPGNNGGDTRVMARHLAERGAAIALFDWRQQRLEDLDGQPLAATWDDWLAQADVVIDGWLGIGHTRPLAEGMQALNAGVAARRQRGHGIPRVVAVDLPSGVDADSGAVDPGTLNADLTITLGAPKIGLFWFPAMQAVGQLQVGSIGLPPALAMPAVADWVTPDRVAALVPERPLDAHKGTFGKAALVAGSRHYPGAAALAARAAARAGVGLVTLATTDDLIPLYSMNLPEVVYAPLAASGAERGTEIWRAISDHEALLIGPGIGQAPETHAWLLALLATLRGTPDEQRPKLVLDADALNLLSREPTWWDLLPPRTILTPHPGEMSRLLGAGAHVSGGGPDRLPQLRDAVARWGQVVVLKGAVTLIGSPEATELVRLNAAPNPAMATAGMGDVLAGTIVSLLAQELTPFDAATLGVALHSEAGAQAARDLGFVRAGVLAGDVADRLPAARAHFDELRETLGWRS